MVQSTSSCPDCADTSEYPERHATDLSDPNLPSSPLDLFRAWHQSAVTLPVFDPDAIAFSTVRADGSPSTRFVLLDHFDDRGFVLFTNVQSRKSSEIEANPRAGLTTYWRELGRQVRIMGRIEKVSQTETETWFQTQSLASRVRAWASPQSLIINSKADLVHRIQDVLDRFDLPDNWAQKGVTIDVDIPVPAWYGGYRLVPDEMEFLAFRSDQMNERISYRWTGDGWKWNRLAP